MFVDQAGKRMAVEVKGYRFRAGKRVFKQLATAISSIADHVDKFTLVTPFEPVARDRQSFSRAMESVKVTAEWLSGNQFAKELGLGADSFQRRYRASEQRRLPPLDLTRQLSGPLIRRLQESSKPPEAFLRIGERMSVVVALSDLKNFSLFAKAVKPEDLNDAMSKYYRVARELVWEHGGVLDKFIGDAVLAIFGYPKSKENAQISAARFAADLVEIGKPILEGVGDLINEAIETGTRVGISTGDISVLNIGLGSIELSFVGDVINLAARLEHECEVNGCLIDNLTKVAISGNDPTFFKRLSLEGRKLEREKVKGQLTTIQTWQIPSLVIPSISNIGKSLNSAI
jgi:class 3 adenylate cyclase